MCKKAPTKRKIKSKHVRGKGKKRCVVARTDEARKWYERPRDPDDRAFNQNPPDGTLKISQASSVKKTKLIRVLRQCIDRQMPHDERAQEK